MVLACLLLADAMQKKLKMRGFTKLCIAGWYKLDNYADMAKTVSHMIAHVFGDFPTGPHL
jgi:hypothetical protein